MEALLITAIVTVLFVGGATLYFGWQSSISKLYYKLKEKKEGLQYLFTLFMWFVGGMLTFLGGQNESNLVASVFFVGGGFLAYVGTFPRFEEDQQKEHYIMAALGLVITLLALSNPSNYFLPIIIFAVMAGILKVIRVNNYILWVELVFICIVFGKLYLKYN